MHFLNHCELCIFAILWVLDFCCLLKYYGVWGYPHPLCRVIEIFPIIQKHSLWLQDQFRVYQFRVEFTKIGTFMLLSFCETSTRCLHNTLYGTTREQDVWLIYFLLKYIYIILLVDTPRLTQRVQMKKWWHHEDARVINVTKENILDRPYVFAAAVPL